MNAESGKRWLLTPLGLMAWALVWASNPSRALAQNIVLDHVKVVWDVEESRDLPVEEREKVRIFGEWKKACVRLGRNLRVGRGPWGFGAFGSFSCYRGEKKIFGKKGRKAQWRLRITDTEDRVLFRISHLRPSEPETVSELELPPSPYTFRFFMDRQFVDLVAYALLEKMPMGIFVPKGKLKRRPPQLHRRHMRAGRAGRFKYEVPPPPEDLVAYRLRWNAGAGLWGSRVFGKGRRKKLVEPEEKKKNEKTKLVGGEVVYEFDPSTKKSTKARFLWAHNAEGPGAMSEKIQEVIKEAHFQLNAAAKDGDLLYLIKGEEKDLGDILLDTAARGYVGVRYGKQVLPGNKLMSKTSILSLLVEIRGGPVEGLRYYYDLLPKTTASQKGADGEVETSLRYSRHTLGYSFDFDPHFLLDRITFDPKIGVWDFEAELASQRNEEGLVVATERFELEDTPSLAAEVGGELISSWHTLRAWYAIDTGYSLLDKGGTVTSNRFGVDAYFTAGPTFPLFGLPVKTALLVFYVYESVTLEKQQTKPKANETAITGVPYDSGFAGAGIALSW